MPFQSDHHKPRQACERSSLLPQPETLVFYIDLLRVYLKKKLTALSFLGLVALLKI